MLAAPGRQDGDGAVEGPAPAPSPVAEAPTAVPEPTSSPEPVAEASPSPSPVPASARVKPDPGPRGPPRASADLPIVMYHHVGPLPPNPDIFRKDLTVPAEVFDQTLDRLADQGVQTVTMADLFEHFKGGPELPKRSAILTFDDGYDDAYEYALHSLLKRGMVGTFFICTDFVDQPGYLTWDQIHEMADAGMEIAAHGTNHADFAQVSPAELRHQLVEPKAILEEQLGHKIPYLAYPSGKYNVAVIAASKAAGYEAAVTVIHGTHHTPSQAFELRRVRAHGADSVAEIVARMTPASWRQ
jgi:peptidoglycan/xylan/chitin deacetylase (PgdA/CDA1 family)